MKRLADEQTPAAFRPVRVVEVELSAPVPAIPATRPDMEAAYGGALVVARLHGEPIGQLTLDLPPRGLDADATARVLQARLAGAIHAHLRGDGETTTPALGSAGLSADGRPPCVEERDRFLAGDPPSVSVIVPTRERPERLRRCLDSILAAAYPGERREVIVVDNAPSSDVTRALLETSFPSVRYLREDAPGSASARNHGIARAGGDIVAFTDDDVVVDRHWLAELARGYAIGGEVGAVTGLLVPLELETPAQVWFEEYGGFGRGYERQVYSLRRPHRDNPLFPYSAGVFGTGNSMSFRRSVLQRIGGFDAALGNGTPALGGVDSEVLLRTVLDGYTVVYEPRSLAYHAHRADYAGLRRQVYGYGAGLSAYLLKTMIERPRLLPDFAARIPRGLAYALHPRSTKNSAKSRSYPRQLTLDELRGMAYGPIGYFRSRRRYAGLRAEARA